MLNNYFKAFWKLVFDSDNSQLLNIQHDLSVRGAQKTELDLSHFCEYPSVAEFKDK